MAYFDKILGQKSVCDKLMSQINNGKTSHAYLFEGPDGCGKISCAKEFAKALLNNPKFDASIEADTHPDVKILKPQGMQTYLSKQIKDLVADSSLAPIQAEYKVYIVIDADRLGSAGANAFLKTLEEPTEHTCFILLTSNQNNVLPTILSRCQTIKFNQLPADKAVEFVANNSRCEKQDAKVALDLFGGNTTKAIRYCLNQNMHDFTDEIENLIENLNTLNDWDTLVRTNDIFEKLKEILDVQKAELDSQTKDLVEVLEGPAIALIEEQNKRTLGNLRKELLSLMCSCIKLYYRKQMDTSNDTAIQISKINTISELEANLKYNINPQIFCDVLFLKLKRI